jgi:Fe-S-cluster containining protein
VTDSTLLAALKRVVCSVWTAEYAVRRLVARLRGTQRYRLGGTCGSCAHCCEAPSIKVGLVLFYMPTPRRLFLWWQRKVNGFTLRSVNREERVFVMSCGHFDTKTRRCDSYASRPFMCRDYPRLLLEQPWPEFFPGCGHRAVDVNAARLGGLIEAATLSAEQKHLLRRRLHVLRDGDDESPR